MVKNTQGNQPVEALASLLVGHNHVRKKYHSIFQQALFVSDMFTNYEPNACGGFSESVLHVGNPLYPPETIDT